MDDLDLSWMAPEVRRAFDQGVRLFAEAVRDGAVMHLQDAQKAMERAAQLNIRLEEGHGVSGAADPSI